MGFEQLFSFIKRSPRRILLTTVCLLFLGFLPIYKSVEIVWKQDDVFVRAGKWIEKIPELEGAGLITNDRRISFYAGRGGGFYPTVGYDDAYMERLALRTQSDLLAIKRSKRKKKQPHQFAVFTEVKEFVGKKNIVDIYCSPEVKKAVDRTGVN